MRQEKIALIIGKDYTVTMQTWNWNQCEVLERHPDRVSGEWLFRGTRVPVRRLFENLEDGATVDDYLAWFPGVSRQQIESVLEHASASLAQSNGS